MGRILEKLVSSRLRMLVSKNVRVSCSVAQGFALSPEGLLGSTDIGIALPVRIKFDYQRREVKCNRK